MNQFPSNILKSVFVLLLLTFSICRLSAQTNSRVAITANETKTTVWVSDFPKNATVLLIDADNNLLSIASTNEFGTAVVRLNKAIKMITARTINGDILVSNEILQKEVKDNVIALIKTNSQSEKA